MSGYLANNFPPHDPSLALGPHLKCRFDPEAAKGRLLYRRRQREGAQNATIQMCPGCLRHRALNAKIPT
jgi:hypothetical protein